MKLRLVVITILGVLAWSLYARSARTMSFEATAYAIDGITASGIRSQPGTVAADTDILPLGTRIRITYPGGAAANYLVADTGEHIQGRRIDIFVPNKAAAKRFGRRMVRVTVLKWGPREKAE